MTVYMIMRLSVACLILKVLQAFRFQELAGNCIQTDSQCDASQVCIQATHSLSTRFAAHQLRLWFWYSVISHFMDQSDYQIFEPNITSYCDSIARKACLQPGCFDSNKEQDAVKVE